MPQHCENCCWTDRPACPFWLSEKAGFKETNVETGEERFVEGCITEVLPLMLTHTVKAAIDTATHAERTANEIAAGFEKLNQVAYLRLLQDSSPKDIGSA